MKQPTDKELATILAALRYWQQDLNINEEPPISDHFAEQEPLTSDDIDTLCESLNCDSPEPDVMKLLEECRDLLGLSDVRFKICDGGRGNLGESSRYNAAMNATNKVLRAAKLKTIAAEPGQVK